MKRAIVGLIVLGEFFAALSGVAGEAENKKNAVSAAKEWLALIDEGKYGKSCNEAAEYFRNAVKLEQWEHAMQSARQPLCNIVSRTVKSTSYKTSLPGAPDGEYVVIQFSASYEKKKSAIETVTPMLDKDGKWRVSGYYIK